jgi:cellulose synthase/poly-beta-1,6-N-acetylglucosamine synthase-like glycosyltransferase
LIVAALNFVSFRVLFTLEDRFEAIAGVPTFDTQNDLTSATLLQQLPRYVGAARAAYGWFAAFDWVFPFIASLFLAVLWAWLLRTNALSIAQRLLQWTMPVWVFAVTLFDWLENISLIAIVYAGVRSARVVEAAIVWKQLKLAGLTASAAITVLLVVLALVGLLQRVWRAHMIGIKTS